ncbi:hypothetical protein VR44_11490 [Streptomyces katrae]|uniref:Uncharacterized protein n=1 Tax=Streptomyces katrae TaxID=68223 RepID=A0A0F4JLQ2_9ACTN|nr:hypothetical protein VR44_11490 [Streptomyces katrae]
MPSSANAAVGEFLYSTGPLPGIPAGIADPESRVCHNLYGATETDPAYAPKNLTNATATAFLDFDCAGDTYYVIAPGRVLGNRLKLRSVIFS